MAGLGSSRAQTKQEDGWMGLNAIAGRVCFTRETMRKIHQILIYYL